MLQRISRHSKQRICQRANGVSTFSESRKQAIQAFRSGQSIGDFQNFPEFFEYLRKVKERTSNSTTIRVYKGLIYIWRGNHRTLVTAYKVPYRFLSKFQTVEE